MHLNLDIERIKTMIELWKDGVDLRVPMADEFKLHFISQRMVILNNFELTSSAWLMMIGAMSSPDHPETVIAIRDLVKDFNVWATNEIATLKTALELID